MLRAIIMFFAASTVQKELDPASVAQSHLMPQKDTTSALLEKYCKIRTIDSTNKPLYLRVGMNTESISWPVSCLSNVPSIKKNCQADGNRWYKYLETLNVYNKPQLDIWDQRRITDLSKFDAWKSHFYNRFNLLTKDIYHLDDAKKLRDQLTVLKKYYFQAQSVVEMNFGNCGEQAAFAGMKLFSTAKKLNLNLNMKMMILSRSAKFDKNGNTPSYLNDHTYLLINDPTEDVAIYRDPEAVAKYLDAVEEKRKSTLICDPWNDGYLALYKNKISLYDNAGRWESVIAKPLMFEENLLQNFSEKLADLFRDECAEMGVYLSCSNEIAFDKVVARRGNKI